MMWAIRPVCLRRRTCTAQRHRKTSQQRYSGSIPFSWCGTLSEKTKQNQNLILAGGAQGRAETVSFSQTLMVSHPANQSHCIPMCIFKIVPPIFAYVRSPSIGRYQWPWSGFQFCAWESHPQAESFTGADTTVSDHFAVDRATQCFSKIIIKSSIGEIPAVR